MKAELANSVSSSAGVARLAAAGDFTDRTVTSARKLGSKALALGLCAFVLGLAWFSYRLAGIRIYQVDECQNVYSAWLLATGQAKSFLLNLSLFHFPLMWVSHGAARAADFFVCGRFLAFEIFWLNLVLIALATGERLRSARGALALAGAATLAPLWDYGFEIRHDNLVMTMLLLTWIVVRVRPAGKQSYFIAGVLAVALEFVALKAVIYVLPLSLAILAFPPPGHGAKRRTLVLAWLAGALGTLLLVCLLYGAAGVWEVNLAGMRRILQAGVGDRFYPWRTLNRLLSQTPLLLALAASGLVALGLELGRRGRAALNWEGNLPEGLLCAGAIGALLVNPNPFAYNLLHLVPYAFLVAFRYAFGLWRTVGPRQAFAPFLVSALIFAHLVPFLKATGRHLDWTNYHQEARMGLAAALTDPSKDFVYDGIGMVPTRRSVHYQWLLHGSNIDALTKGNGPRWRDLFAGCPAAVFIPSFRTDWLNEKDDAFIRQRYVCLSDDFWVLGSKLPAGGGTFEIVHPGRYRISSLKGSDLAGTYPEGIAGLLAPVEEGSFAGTLDGVLLPNHPVELSLGTHRIESPADCQPVVVWVGPKLDRIGRQGESDHKLLFVNWY